MKYQSKQYEVEAAQFDGSEESYMAIMRIIPPLGSAATLVKSDDGPTNVTRLTIGNGLEIKHGHWIVIHNGVFATLSDKAFRSEYNPLPPTHSTIPMPATKPEIADWAKRVIAEEAELADRIVKLQNFIDGDKSGNLDPFDYLALENQLSAMKQYQLALNVRIARF